MRAALVARALRGAFPPVDLRAVCLVRAIFLFVRDGNYIIVGVGSFFQFVTHQKQQEFPGIHMDIAQIFLDLEG